MDALTKLDVLKSLYTDPGELDGILDKLLDLVLSQQRGRLERYERDLSAFEARHGMASAEFYRRFSAGELGDNLDWFEWAGLYELKEGLLRLIQRLEPDAEKEGFAGSTPWAGGESLFHIKGVGEEYLDLLRMVGVDTIPALARHKAEDLFLELARINAAKKLVRRLPSREQVAGWVAQAKALCGIAQQ